MARVGQCPRFERFRALEANRLHQAVAELKADSPRARPMSRRGPGALAMDKGGRQSSARFSEVKQSVESMKKRKKRLGDFTKITRSSARISRWRRRDETDDRSRPISAAAVAWLG